MLQLGWKAGPEQYPPVELMDYAVSADKAGYDLLDVSDHFNPWSEEGQAPFTWTWLGAVATHTERIILSPGVTCPMRANIFIRKRRGSSRRQRLTSPSSLD
jgi:coenzyme F420-dependent glucose-6-phosphate dehydrogenase